VILGFYAGKSHNLIGLGIFHGDLDDVCSTNILVLLVLAAPIGEDTQTFYNLKNFSDFLNVCSANILVLTGLQHQYIGAVQGESKCYSVKRCLFSQLE
jgi:hypothetical protein